MGISKWRDLGVILWDVIIASKAALSICPGVGDEHGKPMNCNNRCIGSSRLTPENVALVSESVVCVMMVVDFWTLINIHTFISVTTLHKYDFLSAKFLANSASEYSCSSLDIVTGSMSLSPSK